MSKSMISALVAAMALAAAVPVLPSSATAAELPLLPPAAAPERAASCGPCGCLHVTYDYHPELRSTYGLSFDPRNYDQTQPHYYWGPVRAYPRYWCDVETVQ